MQNNIKNDIKLFNNLIKDFLESEINSPVSEIVSISELESKLNITLNEDAIVTEQLKKELKNILQYTPKSSSKLFFNQLYGGRHSKAVLGELLAVFINNSMATYKIAGPQVGIEKEIIKIISKIIGYKEDSGGTFPTGGSMSNFMSLIMARDKKDINIKNKGVGINNRLVIYVSETSHYSVQKNVSFSGIGKENIRYIQSNAKGEIELELFKKQINEDIANNFIPLYLNATAGTTVACAFDPVQELVKICKKYKIWLHLDGAFGGAVIFSQKHKYLVKGISEVDSFSFNAHKTLGAPLSTSILVVKNKKHLEFSFSNEASYLYQTHNNEYNLGHTSFECGRRNNALKLWTMWKSIGTKGLSSIVDHEFELAEVARNYLEKHPDYTLYEFSQNLSICFNYKNYEARDLCNQLYESGSLMIGFGEFKEKRFVRLVVVNFENNNKDILNVFKIIEEFGKEKHKSLKKTTNNAN
jgi:sulfinoalanine decarboxylase